MVRKTVAEKLEAFYRKSCKCKQRHADPCWALWACVATHRKYRENVFAYKCVFCPFYHVGHTPLLVRDFIKKLVGPPDPPYTVIPLSNTLSGGTVKTLRPRFAALPTT